MLTWRINSCSSAVFCLILSCLSFFSSYRKQISVLTTLYTVYVWPALNSKQHTIQWFLPLTVGIPVQSWWVIPPTWFLSSLSIWCSWPSAHLGHHKLFFWCFSGHKPKIHTTLTSLILLHNTLRLVESSTRVFDNTVSLKPSLLVSLSWWFAVYIYIPGSPHTQQ